jgi:hypothetical protein
MLSQEENVLVEEDVMEFKRKLMLKLRVDNRVNAYRDLLTTQLLLLKENDIPDIDNLSINSNVSNITLSICKDSIKSMISSIDTIISSASIDTIVSSASIDTIVSSDCKICLEDSIEFGDFIFFLETNCPCKIRACFDCWNEQM